MQKRCENCEKILSKPVKPRHECSCTGKITEEHHCCGCRTPMCADCGHLIDACCANITPPSGVYCYQCHVDLTHLCDNCGEAFSSSCDPFILHDGCTYIDLTSEDKHYFFCSSCSKTVISNSGMPKSS